MALKHQHLAFLTRHSYVLLIWLGLALFRCFGAATADEVIQKVEKRYNTARSLSIHFEERYSFMGHFRPLEAGTLQVKKQGKMRWDYTIPRGGKLFISDGKTVYLYTSGDNRVEKAPLKSTEDVRAPLAFLLGHLDLKHEFTGFAVQDLGDTQWLIASAKSDKVPFSSIRMLIGPAGEVTQLQVTGRDKSEVDYRFTDEKLNVKIPDSIFHFSIPAGAQVVNSADINGQGI